MSLFKKNEKLKKDQKKEDFLKEIREETIPPEYKIIKKRKIGLGRNKGRNQTSLTDPQIDIKDEIELENNLPQKEESEVIEEAKKPYTINKNKSFIKKDLKDKPVFLEDTGEKLGVVFDNIYDKEDNIIGYKIKDNKSEAILSFPLDQFEISNDGLIFVPSWYANAIKIIEKLEFKDKISPEITALLYEETISADELYEIFVKHDDEMVSYINDAISLIEMLNSRLKILEKQRIALKGDLIDLTEKRLIKDIDRRQFSEDVMNHRRRVNILDLNIEKCKKLIKRIDETSFGALSKNSIVGKSGYRQINPIRFDNNTSTEEQFKNKYFTLKTQYDQLEEEFQILKSAVDKLVSKEVDKIKYK